MKLGSLRRLAVALDTTDHSRYQEWCRLFGPRVGVLKVGLEAFIRWGPPAVSEAREHGHSVFLDLKLHDIPNTVAGAVSAARQTGATYLTVHAAGGGAMLAAAVEAAQSETRILAVTVLTHLDQAELEVLNLPGLASDRVLLWAELAHSAGCAGIVCSPNEAARLRVALPPPFLLVTPGIRSGAQESGDQRRTATAAEARAAGSDLVVVGRPLTAAKDPLAVLADLERDLS